MNPQVIEEMGGSAFLLLFLHMVGVCRVEPMKKEERGMHALQTEVKQFGLA